MGAQQSKSFNDLTRDEVAEGIRELGSNFEIFAEAALDNGVDGSLLSSLDEDELRETLEDLGVSSRLHARVLTNKWKTVKSPLLLNKQPSPDSFKSEPENVTPPDITNDVSKKNMVRKIAEANPKLVIRTSFPPPTKETLRQLQAAAACGITEDTPSHELQAFDSIAERAFQECHSVYAGVHLLDEDGHTSLGSRYYLPGDDPSVKKDRLHAPRGISRCYEAIVNEASDCVQVPTEPGSCPFLQADLPANYVGHVVKDEDGERIGMVCLFLEEEPTDENQELLKELAAQTAQQLEERKLLMQWNEILRKQIDEVKMQDVLLPGNELLKTVTQSDVDKLGTLYPMPDDIAVSRISRRSAKLPFTEENRATEEEMNHLPIDFYDFIDSVGADRAPVRKDDAERVAALEAMGLKDLPPTAPTAAALKGLTDMAGNLFDVPWAEITMVDHAAQYGFCRFIKLDAQDVATQELKDAAFSMIYEPLSYAKDGEPFLCRARIPRAVSLCNYTIHAQQPFTIHDIQADESFTTWAASPARFYSGAPIFINGYVVATFCLIDSRPRPDFTKAHEIQLQQMAVLAAQHIENWSLRQEMERLETARRRAVSTSEKRSPPDDVAALIFTDIQGSTTLWESNPRAMQVALNLHDEIMRKCITEHHGYEVLTEGDAFHIAFHDAVDATLFALEAQQNLQNAQWDDEILALPDAADDGRGFRGVRVRIAIHCGDVKSQDNKVSGRREYSGRTYHIAKSLEHMSHGGQVLATHDVWNAVSYLSESKLGSPQVIDLGTHVLWTSKSQREGVIAKGVVELVPKELAFDYSRSREHQTEEKMEGPTDISHPAKHSESLESLHVDFGRHFPPPISSRRLSAAFHDAPCANTRAAIAFIYTLQIEKRCDDPSAILAALAKLIGTLLGPGPGYQCKNFMLAFPCTTDAVEFGMLLQETLKEDLLEGEDLHGLVQVGIHEGPFSSLVPHKVTGRADYFGKVVNRAARVAGAAHPGNVVVAVVEGTALPELGSSFDTIFLGTKALKGVQEEMALYACSRK